jgi:MFS family permease
MFHSRETPDASIRASSKGSLMAVAGTTPPRHSLTRGAEPADEGQVLAKIRRRLIPFMFLLYIVSYLDRVNVGFAALQMNQDLGLSASVFGLGSGIFFIGYFLFELPSTLIMERVGARLWIARIMISWGLVSAGMMFVQGTASFFLLRFLLGIAEAGFFPGIILYLTYWFPGGPCPGDRPLHDRQRGADGAIGGPLGAKLLRLDGTGGLHGWQWLFLLEGLPAVVLGVVTLLYLPDGPQDAAWLSDRERLWLKERLAADRVAPAGGGRPALRQVFASRRVWMFCALYFLIVLGLYSISFWLPQILKGLSGSSDFLVGILSALPYIVAAVGMVWIGRHSDRHGERRWHVAGPALPAALGFVLSTQTTAPALLSQALRSRRWVSGAPSALLGDVDVGADRVDGCARDRVDQLRRQPGRVRRTVRGRPAQGCDGWSRRGDGRARVFSRPRRDHCRPSAASGERVRVTCHAIAISDFAIARRVGLWRLGRIRRSTQSAPSTQRIPEKFLLCGLRVLCVDRRFPEVHVLSEIVRQILLRVAKDFDNRLAIGRQELGVARVPVLTGQHLPEAPVDEALGGIGQRAERVGVNHVTARVSHQAPIEIELPQRSAFAVGGTARGELLGKAGRAPNLVGKRHLVDEQHVVRQVGGCLLNPWNVGRLAVVRREPRLPPHARDEVGHVRLVLEDHQCRYVALRRQIS